MSYPQTKNDESCCDTCKWYSMIDSGYGWCIKNPPQFILVPKRFLFFFTRFEVVFNYPEVPWNLKPCGDYKNDNKNQRRPEFRPINPLP